MKTTQKEAILNKFEKDIEGYGLEPHRVGILRGLITVALDTYAESKLSQIKEEIEKVIDKTLNDFDAKVLKKEIDSHMEEKGQEK